MLVLRLIILTLKKKEFVVRFGALRALLCGFMHWCMHFSPPQNGLRKNNDNTRMNKLMRNDGGEQ